MDSEKLPVLFFISAAVCLLFAAGIAIRHRPKLAIMSDLTDLTRDNRLTLCCVEMEVPDWKVPELGPCIIRAHDFHSLVWDKKVGDAWVKRLAITKKNFAQGIERWIVELQSFNSAAGTAILKVAEVQPEVSGVAHCEYSWREWDLEHNRQRRLLQVCSDPFESFNDNT
jgi:hypothetical protein